MPKSDLEWEKGQTRLEGAKDQKEVSFISKSICVLDAKNAVYLIKSR